MAQGLAPFMADGHEVRIVEPEDMAASISPDMAVVMITDVDYRTARRHNMKEISKLAHDAEAFMIWDLAHNAGAIPVDLKGSEADFAVGCHLLLPQWRTRCAGVGMTPLCTSFADIWTAAEVLSRFLDEKLWNRPEFLMKRAVT